MGALSDVKALLHPYHIFNLIFSFSYLSTKLTPVLCELVFPVGTVSELTGWENQVLFFMLITVMFRTRRTGCRTLLAYITTATYYAKACNAVLWFSADPTAGLIYTFIIMVHFLLVGEPVPPKGPENVTYFAGLEPLTEALEATPDTTWLITYYAPWAGSTCNQLTPVFSQLSNNYSLPNLKFGKVDVSRYPDVAEAHKINTSAITRQLPTIALFRGGKLMMRRPTLDSNRKIQRFYFTMDNIVAAYDLNNVYLECKRKSKEPKSKKKDE